MSFVVWGSMGVMELGCPIFIYHVSRYTNKTNILHIANETNMDIEAPFGNDQFYIIFFQVEHFSCSF